MTIRERELGQRFNENYNMNRYIGGGGNGIVFSVTRNDGEKFALKCLKKDRRKERNKKRKVRFINEIESIKKLNEQGNKYTIPLIDYNISEDGLYWYVMPIGKTISSFFKTEETTTNEKIKYFIEIAKGLKSIHDSEYCHRDIKPNNILVVKNNIKLADFGLVWHPDFDSITSIDENIGARETIAPEMRENDIEPKHSPRADVYSYVKTIWMLLLNRKLAFAGKYNYDTTDYLDIGMDIFKDTNIKTLTRLNEIIMNGTENKPHNRPFIDDIIKELEQFIDDNQLPEYEIAKINERETINRKLYLIVSDVESYTDIKKIEAFLEEITEINNYLIGVDLSDDNSMPKMKASSAYKSDDNFIPKMKVSSVYKSDIKNCIILYDDSLKKRYLIRINVLDIEKENNKMTFMSEAIDIVNIPSSDYYDYKDYYSQNMTDAILGSFDDMEGKTSIEVITKPEKFVMKIDKQHYKW